MSEVDDPVSAVVVLLSVQRSKHNVFEKFQVAGETVCRTVVQRQNEKKYNVTGL